MYIRYSEIKNGRSTLFEAVWRSISVYSVIGLMNMAKSTNRYTYGACNVHVYILYHFTSRVHCSCRVYLYMSCLCRVRLLQVFFCLSYRIMLLLSVMEFNEKSVL